MTASPRRLHRPVVWMPVVVLIVSVLAAAVTWTAFRSAGARAEQRSMPAPPFTAERAAALGADLTSGDPARVRRAVAVPPGQSIEAAAVVALARLRVRVDPATFTAMNARTGTVSMSVAQPDATSAVVVCALLYTQDWQLVDTIPGG